MVDICRPHVFKPSFVYWSVLLTEYILNHTVTCQMSLIT